MKYLRFTKFVFFWQKLKSFGFWFLTWSFRGVLDDLTNKAKSLNLQGTWERKKRRTQIRTVVSEVSFFVSNPVYTNIYIFMLWKQPQKDENYFIILRIIN